MKTIILASNNKGKIKEIKDQLKKIDIQVISQKEAGVEIEVNETGTTYKENAYLKAKAIYDLTKMPVIADDGGLEIDYLDGKPGVYTARFLGEDKPYEEKRKIVLEMLKDAKDEERGAVFRTIICYIEESGKEHFFEGVCEGKIAKEIRGESGMGYDHIFEYNGKTFAEISEEEKNKVSHRGRAIYKFISFLDAN